MNKIMRNCEKLKIGNSCHVPWSGVKFKMIDPQQSDHNNIKNGNCQWVGSKQKV